MHKSVAKIGSYIVLFLGVVITVCLAVAVVVILIQYPEASIVKKFGVAIGVLLAAIIVILMTVAVFEALREVPYLEKEVGELEKVLHIENGGHVHVESQPSNKEDSND
ncbi:MAG TPA: hypothetical protein PK263_03875 [bacterium]|nr:hypothetical protein [bacterium]